jgi:hypothetical protein
MESFYKLADCVHENVSIPDSGDAQHARRDSDFGIVVLITPYPLVGASLPG